MTTIKRPQKWMTAAEHDAWLKETGQYEAVLERQRLVHEEHQARLDARNKTLTPIDDELRQRGLPSLLDLCTAPRPPELQDAIPILIAHLRKKDAYPKDARSLIAYALLGAEMKGYWRTLVQLYRDEENESVKGTIGNSVLRAADASVFDDILALVRDRSVGETRLLFLSILNKSKDPRGKQTILDLADEPDLREEIKAIRKKWERNAVKRAPKAAQKNPTRH